jgi:hypothetical protein
MNKRQAAAAESLRKALNRCAKAGLQGGVFDGSFCVWPEKLEPSPFEMGAQFFDHVAEYGGNLWPVEMHLDGGAGS